MAFVVAPVIGQWFIEYATASGLYKNPVGRAHHVVAALTSSTWFHWVGGIILGFALGVWLDALVRRSDTPRVQEWLTPSEAIRQYLDPYYTEAFDKAQATYLARQEIANSAHGAWAADPENVGLRDEFQDRSTETSLSAQLKDTCHRISAGALVDALKGGALIAKGIEVAGGVARDEDTIPTAYWRFMSINVDGEDAGGNGRRYAGVRIAFPNRPDAESRLPPLTGTGA